MLRLRRFGIKISQASNSVPNLLVPQQERMQFQLISPIWVFPKIMVPQNGWFITENPINPWMIWGDHYFRKHPYKTLGFSSFESMIFPFPSWDFFFPEESHFTHAKPSRKSPVSQMSLEMSHTHCHLMGKEVIMRCKLERLWDFLYDSQLMVNCWFGFLVWDSKGALSGS